MKKRKTVQPASWNGVIKQPKLSVSHLWMQFIRKSWSPTFQRLFAVSTVVPFCHFHTTAERETNWKLNFNFVFFLPSKWNEKSVEKFFPTHCVHSVPAVIIYLSFLAVKIKLFRIYYKTQPKFLELNANGTGTKKKSFFIIFLDRQSFRSFHFKFPHKNIYSQERKFKYSNNNFLFQVTIDSFTIGRFTSYVHDGCPDGFLQISESSRTPIGGMWCGTSWAPVLFYSETRSLVFTIKLNRYKESCIMWKNNIQNGLTSFFLVFLGTFFLIFFFFLLFKLQKGWHGIKVDIILTSAFDIKSCLRRVQSLDMEALNLKVRRIYFSIHSTRTTSCGMFSCYTLGGPFSYFFLRQITLCVCQNIYRTFCTQENRLLLGYHLVYS